MQISDNIKYIGVNDHIIEHFEGQYPVKNGMAYNSYVISDEKTAVMDSVDRKFTAEWLGNISAALSGKSPDYLIVQHMEPDHSASISAFAEAYPSTRIVATAKAFAIMGQFFGTSFEDRQTVVGDGDTLCLGADTLTFFTAPMVHWPEVMVTYDSRDRVLFSADAFGKFGALDVDGPWDDEARRYYIGIVGKYGVQVQALLKKTAALDISKICPLHGPVLEKDLPHYIGLYDKWSSYTPEKDGVMIAYTSVYGHTKTAVEALADKLRENGCDVAVYDLAGSDMSQAVADAFAYNRIVFATTTYNADIFPYMRHFIEALTERGFKNRTVAFIENGSWAPLAAKIMKQMFEKSQGLIYAETDVKIRSALSGESSAQLDALALELCESAPQKKADEPEKKSGKGFVCKICGYVYEGDVLPAGFVCPLCKHDASFFEPVK